jgi:hypothetical protein
VENHARTVKIVMRMMTTTSQVVGDAIAYYVLMIMVMA